MHWRITKNIIDEKPAELVDELVDASQYPILFRIYDDDGELYFEGRMTIALYNSGEQIFEPLDEAMATHGATEMRVLDPKTKRWETI